MTDISRQVDGVRSSKVIFTPRSDTAYGSISCQGRSSLGSGAPCLYILLPPGLDTPQPPPCSILNISTVSFKVQRLQSLFSVAGEFELLEN